MRFGLFIFPTDHTPGPAQIARLTEERGFDSLYFPEHTHMPVEHTPYPGGTDLPEMYRRLLDPFVALAAAATATEKLLLGLGICLVTHRDPIITAKEVATLDRISNGRVLFGVGAGWNRPELENHGAPFDRRFAVMRERVQAMKEIWTGEVAEYHGRYVDFGPLWSWPKPVQQPHPPIVMGGVGPKVVDRVLDYADEWMPNREIRLAERVAELRERAGKRVPVTYLAAPSNPESVERLIAADVDRIVFLLGQRMDLEPRMDRLVELAAPYR